MPLSHIPHTLFAQIGEGGGSCKFLIFFPRMMHMDEMHAKHWVNKIPSQVQELWLEEVIIPAIWEVATPGQQPYMDFSSKEMSLWNGLQEQVPDKQYLLTNEQLHELQIAMHHTVQWGIDQENLAMFGSFFFLADLKGVKMCTQKSQNDGHHKNSWDLLCDNFPALDWEHMINPLVRTLFVDLGISYQLLRNPPMVGAWKLNYLCTSYNKGNLLTGKMHHACQLT